MNTPSVRFHAARTARRGGVLVMALVAVAAVAALIAGIVEVSSRALQREQDALDTKRAFYLAEAGLAEAYTGLRVGKTGNVGTRERPASLGEGVFWTEARDLGGDRVELRSTGMRGRARSLLSMCVERGEESVATLGVFSSEPLVVPEGSRITGTDTSAPPPASEPAPAPSGGLGGLLGGVTGTVTGLVVPPPPPIIGRLGSNGDVQALGTLRRPTTLHADVGAGPRRTATFAAGVTHLGTTRPRTNTAVLPDVVLPFEPDQPAITRGSGTALVLPPGEHGLDALRITSGGRVVVQGPSTLVVGTLSVASNGALELDSARGPIEVFARDAMTFAAGSSVSSTSPDPSQLVVQYAGSSPVTLAATARLPAVVYAPGARVDVAAPFKASGALVARLLVLAQGVDLSFDTHLDEVAAHLALPQLLTWRIVELATESKNGLGRDPYAILGIDRASLPAPAAAHEDVLISVTYENLLGAVSTYTGMESGFDWTNARAVSELTRNGTRVVEPDRGATAAAPATSTGVLDALLGVVPMTIRALEDLLRESSPLGSTEIVAAITREPRLSDAGLIDVLTLNSPLGSAELDALIDRTSQLSSAAQRDLMLRSTPLPPDVLARVIAGETTLSDADRRAVVNAQ